MVVFGLKSLLVPVPRQFALVSQCQHGVGCEGKPCGCDCPSQLWKVLFSHFQTLKTTENFTKCSSIGQLNIIRNSEGLKTGLG